MSLARPSASTAASTVPRPEAEPPTLELLGPWPGAGKRTSLSARLDRSGWLVSVEVAYKVEPGRYGKTVLAATLFDRKQGQSELMGRTLSGGPAQLSWANVPSLSADGCCVAWSSEAPDVVTGDGNGKADVFLTRRDTGNIERISVSKDGGDADGESFSLFVTSGGERVFFFSDATNLVPGDTNRHRDLFVREVATKTTRKVELSNDGRDVERGLLDIGFAADGSVAVFSSQDEGLLGLPRSSRPVYPQVFVRALALGKTECLTCGWSPSVNPSVSRNGRYVVFTSSRQQAPTDPPGDAVYVYDREKSKLEQVFAVAVGTVLESPVISDDGRIVAFVLTPDDPNLSREREYGEPFPEIIKHVIALDRESGKLLDLSLGLNGEAPNGPCFRPSISANGDVVGFHSEATNLVPGQELPKPGDSSPPHSFVYDGVRRAGKLQRIAVK